MSQAPSSRRSRFPQVSHAEEHSGTRSVERALKLLKELSSRGEFGWRLSDLSEQVGLDRATCHRLLACFVKEGFAQRQAHDLKYYPGQLLFEMGLALPRFESLRQFVDPRLERLAAGTGCIASFTLRSGNDMVCTGQKRAGIDIAGMLVRVGTRRPMVTMVGGLSVLQRLPSEEAARIIEENHAREFARGGARRIANLERMRRRSVCRGFGFTLGDLAPGLAALAVPICNATDVPFAALTLTGNDTTLNEHNASTYHGIVADAAAEIEAHARKCVR